jgi:mono/diheme cytochrome c family protein
MTRRLSAAIVWLSIALATAAVVRADAGTVTSSPMQSQTGATVWNGVYTAAQAKRGEAVSNRSCAKCHNADLTGGQDGPSLVGQEALAAWSGMTLGDLFDRIRMTMPADAPQSLSAQETADILAYALSSNKCPAGDRELPADVAALRQIRVTSRPDPAR